MVGSSGGEESTPTREGGRNLDVDVGDGRTSAKYPASFNQRTCGQEQEHENEYQG
jgi:hypothetical protein